MISLAIAAAMVLCWLLEILHPALAGFIGAFLFCAIGVDFDTAFHGFGTETPWFLYGALLLAGAAERSGLVAALSARAPRALAASIVMPAVALVVLAYGLAFVVPSALARATMLTIVGMAWAPRTPEPRSHETTKGVKRPVPRKREIATPEYRNLVLVAAYAAAMFGHPDLPGGPLSVIGWDVAAAIAVLVGGVFLAGKTSPEADATPAAAATTTPANAAIDFKIAAPVALAIAIWLTTPFHGVSPALVGLGCGLVCCLPGIAPPGKLQVLNADHLAVVFVGTAISIPAVLVETKAAESLTALWSNFNAAGLPPQDVVAYWSTTAYRVFSPDGARPPLPPLDAALGSAAIWSYAGSTLLSLHQSPALVLAMSVGGCRARQVLTIGAMMLILGSIVVISLP